MKGITAKPWPQRLRKVQGSQEKRTRRISNTLSELRTQLTPQFAKSVVRAPGFARKSGDAAFRPGFTTIELMIATSVFSVILLLSLTGFFQLGSTFYKGVAQTQTEAVTKEILNSVSEDIKFAPAVVKKIDINPIKPGQPAFMCLGNARYTFNLYTQVNVDNEDLSDAQNPKGFGILRDVLPGNGRGCAPYTTAALKEPKELLGGKMRLAIFDVLPINDASTGTAIPDLWKVQIKTAYGDDGSLTGSNDKIECNSGLKTSQYCAVTDLTTSVTKGYK